MIKLMDYSKRFFHSLILGAVLLLSSSSFALASQEINNPGGHTTPETALEVPANKETYAEVDPTDRTQWLKHRVYINGTTNGSNYEWYKVYLDSGYNYLTCNGGSFKATIMDPDNNEIKGFSDTVYMNNDRSSEAKEFYASKSGYYHVGIKGLTGASVKYTFLIGNPMHYMNTLTLRHSSKVNLTDRRKCTVYFNAQNASVPDDAVVYSISNGNGVGIASLHIVNNGNNQSADIYYRESDIEHLLVKNMKVKSIWTVTYTGVRTKTFTPILDLNYIYALKSGSPLKRTY